MPARKTPYRTSAESKFLVALQAVLLIFLATGAPRINHRIDLLIWELAGTGLTMAGLLGLSRNSFSVFAEPKPEGRLVTGGVYSFIRHPMYAGILLIFSTLVAGFYTLPRLLALLALGVVLLRKIFLEEAALQKQFAGYSAYRQQTSRLIPFVW
jgi:protein-S-isoprenylcysteine O-methyltransferase Ste14